MTGFLQAWSVRWQAPASSARAGAGAAAASRDGTGRPASAAAARLLTDYPPVGRILPLAGLLVLGLGFQQVGDRTAKRRADPVQIIPPHRDRLVSPQRRDLEQRRREADLLEGLQQVAGPPDVPLGRDPAQVPLHPKLPLSTASRCAALPADARLARSGSAWAVARYRTVVVAQTWPSNFCTSHSDMPRS